MAASTRKSILSVFVLGSTSEVAQALCRELGRRGCRRFHLVARNDEANRTGFLGGWFHTGDQGV